MNAVFELLKELKQEIQLLKNKDVAAKTEPAVPVKKPFADFLKIRCTPPLPLMKDGYYGLFLHNGKFVTYSFGFTDLSVFAERWEKDKMEYENVPNLTIIKIIS